MSLDANAFSDLKSSKLLGQGGIDVILKTRVIGAVVLCVAVVAQSVSLAADNAPAAPVVGGGTPVVATPKPTAEVEKWFAQVDGPQEDAFQKQVLKPYEAGTAELRARYLASLDAALAKTSAAGQLKEALSWRTERQAFEKAQNVAADDDTTPAGVKAVRAAFRQQLAKLDEERTAKAKAMLASYDGILAKNQTLLTQHQRLDDALLLQTKRDAIALAWLGKAQSTTAVAVVQPEAAKADATKTEAALVASKERPFVNSLGMQFVPVPIVGGPTDGQQVLFSLWDTRVQDYEAFVKETNHEWPKVYFEQGPTHPAVNVNFEDAKAFCAWLTEREHKTGNLASNEAYRLPSDHEWSCAVGIGEREVATKLPGEKNAKINNAFPWGTQWPPPKGAGNYAGEELRPALVERKYDFVHGVITGYNDGFVNTSPVGSFAANRFGLFDIGGNVWQWCESWFEKDQKKRVLRGCGWNGWDRTLSSSTRYSAEPGVRSGVTGFRCVVSVAAR